MKKNNRKGSIVLISLLLVGFLLVLSVGILNVLLIESKDTYTTKNSLKAFYGAESGLELALLRLKKKGFGYEYELKYGDKKEGNVLAEDLSNFSRKDTLLAYKIESKSTTETGSIESGKSVIYPLFYKTGSQDFSKKSTILDTKGITVSFTNLSTMTGGLITWGIIGTPRNNTIETKGINGTGSGGIVNGDSIGITKIIVNDGLTKKLKLKKEIIKDFLNNHTGSYLQIQNLNTSAIKYELEGAGIGNNNFTAKYTNIISSATVGKSKQNINFRINNSEYLNIFRFTLYSM